MKPRISQRTIVLAKQAMKVPVAIIAMLLSGCAGHIYYPEHVGLCESKPNSLEWDHSETYERNIESIGKVQFYFGRSDVIDSRSNDVLDDGKNYWLRVTGFTVGRQSTETRHEAEAAIAVPMIFSLTDVAVVTNDGTTIHADDKAYYDNFSLRGYPGSEEVTFPVDLNSDKVQLRPHELHSMHRYESIYIRFPIKRPALGDHWVIHWGAIQLGTEMVAIPDDKLCLHPAYRVTRKNSTVW